MTSSAPPAGEPAAAALLRALLDRVRRGADITGLLAAGVDPVPVIAAIQPIAGAGASVDSVAVNGHRVDAVLSAGALQWRVVFGTTTGRTVDWVSVHVRPPLFAGVPGGVAIVVNGPSGAGKSTLMLAIQTAAAFPVVVLDEPEHVGTVPPGYLIWRDRAPSLHRGYLAAIAALARAGNVVCVSAAGHPHDELTAAFAGIPVVTVGLDCALDVLVRRERRSGRWAGIAAASLGVHDGWPYDLRIDTTDEPDVGEMAQLVLARIPTISSVDRTSPNER